MRLRKRPLWSMQHYSPTPPRTRTPRAFHWFLLYQSPQARLHCPYPLLKALQIHAAINPVSSPCIQRDVVPTTSHCISIPLLWIPSTTSDTLVPYSLNTSSIFSGCLLRLLHSVLISHLFSKVLRYFACTFDRFPAFRSLCLDKNYFQVQDS